MKTNYQLICMSFDGAFVTDSQHETIEQAEYASADMGSKWFFYPFHFIVSGQTVKISGEGLVNMQTKEAYMPKMFNGKRLKTVIKSFKAANKICIDNNIEADTYQFEEILISELLNH